MRLYAHAHRHKEGHHAGPCSAACRSGYIVHWHTRDAPFHKGSAQYGDVGDPRQR